MIAFSPEDPLASGRHDLTVKTEPNCREVLKPLDAEVVQRLTESRHQFVRFFRRRLNRPEDAEDAFQDFCLKAIRSAPHLQDTARIDAWLRRILHSTLTDCYRRRAARNRAQAAYEREPHVLVADPNTKDDPEACGCITLALPALRPDYSEILVRADLNEEPRDEIAAALGLTTNNVGVRLHRARRALRARLEEICGSCRERGRLSCDCPPHNQELEPGSHLAQAKPSRELAALEHA